MNVYKKLLNNSFIFAIGNLGTKLIEFFLLPLYSYYLTKSEFGLMDLFTSTLNLLLPIFSLSIFDAVLRFAMDNNYDKGSVLINSIIVTFIGSFLTILIYPIFVKLLPFDKYILYFYFALFLQLLSSSLTQFIRAIGNVKLYAFSGIINSIAMLFGSILYIIILHEGLKGYFKSLLMSYILSILFVIVLGKISVYRNIKKVDFYLMKEMINYSTPLITNSLMWWVMALSDRYLINFFIGLSANGIYAVANKIPSILNIVNSIFFQAWQMSAIEEAESKDKSTFFTNVFNLYSTVMLLSTSFLLIILKFLMHILVASNYAGAWRYIPFLFLGAVFSGFASFLGTNYIVAKQTLGVFKTSLVGALVNLIGNILLIPIIGINGASISTMLSFFVIFFIRILDTKKFVNIKINLGKFIYTILILMLQILTLYYNFSYEILYELLLFIFAVFINIKEVKFIFSKLLSILNEKFRTVDVKI